MARGNKTNKAQAKEEIIKENPQDDAEEINLNANEKEEVIDTVKAETLTGGDKKEKKTKVKKEKKEASDNEKSDQEGGDKKEKKTKVKKEKKEDSDTEKSDQEGGEKKTKTKKEKKPKEEKEKKRAPSAYNLFVKEIMPQLKKEFEGSDKTQRDLMKVAAERWNEKKNVANK